jgi:hypothetical protein
MNKRKLFKISMLVVTALVTVGCGQKVAPKKQTATKPAPVVATQPIQEASIADIQSAGFGTVALKGKNSYSQNQPIQFIVDTKGKPGYLYIVYLDNKGQTALLYPNEKSPLTELNGQYLFPRDFGGMQINATKDCKGCEQEKTTVYAILSKERITDIKNINASHLSKNSSSSQSKGLSMSLASGGGKSANINVGKIDFFVK